jgi:hypothetical protein
MVLILSYTYNICEGLKASIIEKSSFTAEVIFRDGKRFIPPAVFWAALFLVAALQMLRKFLQYPRIAKTLASVNLLTEGGREAIEFSCLLSFFSSSHVPLRALALGILHPGALKYDT